MKNKIIVLLLCLFTAPLFADVIVDFREADYDDIMEWLKSNDTTYIDAVLISHPFKRIGKTDLVYYFWDSGDYSYQGKSEPEYGTDDDIVLLYNQCYYLGINVYGFVDPFALTDGFNLHMWQYDHFLPESILYYPDYILDIENSTVITYMDYIFDILKNVYVNAWVFDLSKVPLDRLQDYHDFIGNYYTEGTYFIYADTNTGYGNLITTEYYWDLRTTGFVNPVPDLSILTNEEFPVYIPMVDSDELSINNVGTSLFLLSGADNIVIPYTFFESDNFLTLMNTLDAKEDLAWNVADEEVVFLYSAKKVVAFNMSDQISTITTTPMISRDGFYKSEFGGGIMRTSPDYNFFFMLPRSIYVWEIN